MGTDQMFLVLIMLFLVLKHWKGASFNKTGMILFLSGCGAVFLMHGIAGFLDQGSKSQAVLGNIGDLFGGGLLVAALFFEFLVEKDGDAPPQI